MEARTISEKPSIVSGLNGNDLDDGRNEPTYACDHAGGVLSFTNSSRQWNCVDLRRFLLIRVTLSFSQTRMAWPSLRTMIAPFLYGTPCVPSDSLVTVRRRIVYQQYSAMQWTMTYVAFRSS